MRVKSVRAVPRRTCLVDLASLVTAGQGTSSGALPTYSTLCVRPMARREHGHRVRLFIESTKPTRVIPISGVAQFGMSAIRVLLVWCQ